MGALLRLPLVAGHLAAAALPCPPDADLRPVAERATELRAFCPCGCGGAPPGTQNAQLAAALLPVATLPVPALRVAPALGSPLAAPSAHARTPEPVPEHA